ncbi:WecB/TagA/CpsF family glycosyltransferase [Desulfosporosinus sp. PR]|uniref:WecB/TagA/CpsF family glycosyltransferase n=1 Tax=Candidatus Desulfosporosinus nitrosoreducens TaxID=3401928 RepID=UPI0027F9F445|nr:WecB/TagA/CpsF family glycosyltransferase [Desulfosporosinus sp. PR]MDQ7093042.1 WecB/TagA/CpsF family glycosyltransferase [Desulfosporosinus sp. PR]
MKVRILGITVDIYSMAETVEKIRDAIEERRLLRVVTANPEMIYASEQDPALRQVINSADLVTPDGIGVVWAARRLGTKARERVTGIDLMQAIFPAAAAGKWRIYFLGGKPGVAELAGRKVSRDYPGINLWTRHGYFSIQEEPEILEEIRRFKPDVLFVGLGAPRQEFWLAEHPGLARVSIGVGGSFDALAGTVRRAPRQIQELHLEWLYRLLKEPWRWRRQTVLPRFMVKVLCQKLTSFKG